MSGDQCDQPDGIQLFAVVDRVLARRSLWLRSAFSAATGTGRIGARSCRATRGPPHLRSSSRSLHSRSMFSRSVRARSSWYDQTSGCTAEGRPSAAAAGRRRPLRAERPVRRAQRAGYAGPEATEGKHSKRPRAQGVVIEPFGELERGHRHARRPRLPPPCSGSPRRATGGSPPAARARRPPPRAPPGAARSRAPGGRSRSRCH